MRETGVDPESTSCQELSELITLLSERARNLYLTRQFLCTEAVLVTINKGLNGGLSEDQAVAMAAPFSVALGESGCICGALTGAVMACGHFLGNDRPYGNRRKMRMYARELHDTFKEVNGATCCRVLTQKVRHDPSAHFQRCAELTAGAVELATKLILAHRPKLITGAERKFLLRHDSKISGAISWLLRFMLK